MKRRNIPKWTVEDERFLVLPIGARYLYLWLTSVADDFGRVYSTEGACLNVRKWVVTRWLNLLAEQGLVKVGRWRTMDVIELTNFKEYQFLRGAQRLGDEPPPAEFKEAEEPKDIRDKRLRLIELAES